MAFIEWSDRLSVGIPSIDTQHKQLVSIINKLYEAMSTGKANAIMGDLFNELVKYTQFHFANEENLFKTHGYPQAEQHKKEHAALVKQAAELQEKFKSGSVTISLTVANFLKDWLNNHIVVSDKAYAPYLIGKGVK